jgi:hypothetical protein
MESRKWFLGLKVCWSGKADGRHFPRYHFTDFLRYGLGHVGTTGSGGWFMTKGKLTILALGCCTVFAVMTSTGCNNKPRSTSSTTRTPKMKMTTPIPQSITTPDSVDTRIGTMKFENRSHDHGY